MLTSLIGLAGTTAATRKAAAQQIGEIQRCHPYDLHNLLKRVTDIRCFSAVVADFFPKGAQLPQKQEVGDTRSCCTGD